MRAIRKVLALGLLVGLGALATHSGLLEQGAQLTDQQPTTASPVATVDEHGESGALPADPSPPPHALKPSKGLTKSEMRRLNARRIYIAAPLTLGPVQIQAAGADRRPTLLVTTTGVPASTARIALRAARYAYRDTSAYRVIFRHTGSSKRPGRGPVAAAAAQAVRDAVEIAPGRGRTAVSLPSAINVRCTRSGRHHTCTVKMLEFLADRTTAAMNAHLRSYRVTVATKAGTPTATRITNAS